MDEELDRLERECIQMIDMIHESYRKDAEPYVKKLTKIRSLRSPAPIIIDTQTAEQLGLLSDRQEGNGG